MTIASACVVGTVAFNGDWNASRLSWGKSGKRQQLGASATAKEAKAMAQANYDRLEERDKLR